MGSTFNGSLLVGDGDEICSGPGARLDAAPAPDDLVGDDGLVLVGDPGRETTLTSSSSDSSPRSANRVVLRRALMVVLVQVPVSDVYNNAHL